MGKRCNYAGCSLPQPVRMGPGVSKPPVFPVLATVPHTATHFGFHILKQHYFRTEVRGEPKCKRPFWFSHTHTGSMVHIRAKLDEGLPLISTMRHPMLVAQSWIQRSKPMGDDFIAIWGNLFALHDEYTDSFWLPVDTDNKKEYLKAIERRLGLEFKTNWGKYGHYDKYVGEYDRGMTLDETRQFFIGNSDWFVQFGYELKGDNYGQVSSA